MNGRIDSFLLSLGFPSLAELDPVRLVIAGALIGIAVALGAAVRHLVRNPIDRGIQRGLIPVPAERARTLAHLAGVLTGALLIALIRNGYPWPPYANLLLGIAQALALGMSIYTALRVLRAGFWSALAVATMGFVATLSNALGGLGWLSANLDEIGFSLGKYRFSLLTASQIIVGGIVLFALVRLANRVVRHMVSRNDRLDSTQQLLVQKIAAIVIIIVAFFVGIDMLGIDITALTVFSGALGLAVGFGLQKTFGNLIAGIILLIDRSVKPGDVIVIGDAVGRVNKIGVRAVSIITRDGKEHLVPNEKLMTDEVENWSYSSRDVRIRSAVPVSYESDQMLAQQLMLEAVADSPRVLDEPRPVVWITEFGDNAIKHELRYWITDPESGLGNIQGEVFMRILEKFRENGVKLPYPQRDIHVRSWPETAQGDGTRLSSKPRA